MPQNKELRPGERIDDLVIKNLKIIQAEQQFRFSLDAVLLAHFASVAHKATAVDFGTGTGVIGLLLLARGMGKVIGVEIDQDMADMANRSVLLNKLEAKMTVIRGDFRLMNSLLPGVGVGLVISNPPYRKTGQGLMNSKETLASARHELTATLADVVGAAKYLLKYRGRFAMVHLPERLPEIMTALSNADIEPKRLQMVHPFINKNPKMVLIEGVRGGKPGLEIMPPLVVYDSVGKYSEQIEKIYR